MVGKHEWVCREKFHSDLTSVACNNLQDSFGSASYLVKRPNGNVMMDSPRFDAKLLARIKVAHVVR